MHIVYMCVPPRLKSACASAFSEQSFHRAFFIEDCSERANAMADISFAFAECTCVCKNLVILVSKGWMDDLRFYVLFNGILVISG